MLDASQSTRAEFEQPLLALVAYRIFKGMPCGRICCRLFKEC